ncbi:MAG: VOC family protein [Sandaracinaceae bacterium]
MKIKLSGIHVDDQAKAHRFYTEVLGFRTKHDIPLGDGLRWLTVISPEGHDDVELVLEPNDNPAAKIYQAALFEQGIAATAFEVDDVEAEHRRLRDAGVVFRTDPTKQGPVTLAVFSDTCGNLIQIYEPPTE